MTNIPTTNVWPTQVLLPGQAAAPEGPVDMVMMYVMHHAFRRDLAAFAAAAPATPVEDRDAWRALAGRWELFATALHHHHTGEDMGLWPLLMSRADAAGRELLEAMEAEHGEIDPLLEACAAGFARLAERPDADARAALVVRLVAGRESLARHLAHEETDAITLIQQVMTDAEWRQVENDYFKSQPIPPKLVLKMLPWMFDKLPSTVREQRLAEAPLLYRVVYRLFRGSYQRSERRTFRYAA